MNVNETRRDMVGMMEDRDEKIINCPFCNSANIERIIKVYAQQYERQVVKEDGSVEWVLDAKLNIIDQEKEDFHCRDCGEFWEPQKIFEF